MFVSFEQKVSFIRLPVADEREVEEIRCGLQVDPASQTKPFIFSNSFIFSMSPFVTRNHEVGGVCAQKPEARGQIFFSSYVHIKIYI